MIIQNYTHTHIQLYIYISSNMRIESNYIHIYIYVKYMPNVVCMGVAENVVSPKTAITYQ
jgi:hypothetical protein